MKKINILIGTAILSAAFISCRNEAIVDNTITTPNGIQTLHCTLGSYNAPQSRAQVEIGYGEPDKEIFMWNSQDAFTVYDHADIEANATTSYQFTIANYKEEEPSATADFLGEGELPDGHVITAIYPTQKTAVNAGTITLTIPEFSAASMQANTPEEQTAYMSERMFMFATGTVATENNSLAFEQLCAMARITYVNATPDEQTVTNVALQGDGEYFGESMEFNLLEQEGSTPKTLASTSLKFTNLTIPAGNSAEFYLLFFPGKSFNTNGTLTISMNIGNQEYEVTMPTSDIAGNNNGTNGFESSKRYWFNLIQTPDEGLIWKKNMATGIIYNLPLIQAIENENGIQFDKDSNGYVNVETNKDKIASVTSLSLNDITYLDGLEYLTNLEFLDVSELNLSKLDVSNNQQLKELHCEDNKLIELNLHNNPALEKLYCGRNRLTKLDVNSNIALKELSCRENKFQSINLENNTELLYLDCYFCLLPVLEISNNTKLTDLYCGGNQLTYLNVSKNEHLRILNPSGGHGYKGEWQPVPSNLFTSLDLRNNPGGYVKDTVNMLDLILPKGDVLKLVDKSGKETVFKTYNDDQINIPLAVVVNQNSASASEIFASAIKDAQKGVVIGTQTFGKGVVQYVERIKGHGAIDIVSAQYFTSSGVVIQDNGIEPNYVVEVDEEYKNSSYIPRDKDAQLQRAIDYINE